MRVPEPPIGITMGDPAGIGPEIVARLFAEGPPSRCLVIGDAATLARALRLVGADLTVREIASPLQARGDAGRIDLIQIGEPLADVPPGRVGAMAGRASHAYVSRAADEAIAGNLSAIVTAPISKAAWAAAGIDYPGHTEMLAERAGVSDFAMMLANDVLRVVLVSIHVPLADAVRAVTPDAELRAIRLAHGAGRMFGVAAPRVAVAGLNPHAGEDGGIGREDGDIIAPAIALARAGGIDASGPWPGDTVFMRARRGAFDVVVAQYHDQGLIPIKYLGLDDGVNITLGLPFVRTSPDHGTAFDIAWSGRANPASLRAATAQAARLAGERYRNGSPAWLSNSLASRT
jgi:4-hydroxythreonine-4-phosphate dehydrogenase